MKQEISEKEWELIEAIRNYKKAFPRGKRELMWYIRQLVRELTSD